MKRPQRIAILTNYPSDFVSFTGGVETVTDYLLEGFENLPRDLELHVISLSKAVNEDRHVARNGIQYHFLAVPRGKYRKPHLPYNIAKCVFLLNKLRPDLVHCQDNVALALAAAIGGFRRLFTVHGARRTEAKLWRGSTYWSHQVDRILEWLVYRSYHNFIALSPYVENMLNPNKRIFRVPNPVSESFFSIDAGDAAFDKKVILFIGSLVYLKQAHVLIRAFARIRQEFSDTELQICGHRDDDRYYKDLLQMIKEYNLSEIHFVDRLSRQKLIESLSNASVFVLPSIQENSPMTIAEAMAAGMPVVASRVGGIPYMIEHGRTGLLFTAGDAGELAACIRTLLVNKELADRIRKNARQHAMDHYQCRDIARRHVAIYREIMDRAT